MAGPRCRTTTDTGNAMEAAAAGYLRHQGLTLLERNYRCRMGELDLVMRDQHTVVFVEVRYRHSAGRGRSGGFGHGEDSITAAKQRRLLQAARHWLMLRADRRQPEPACRFDVVAVDQVAGEPVFTWHRNAFGA